MTAHVSWYTPQLQAAAVDILIENIGRYLRGRTAAVRRRPGGGLLMPGAVVVGTGFGCRVHVPALRNAGFTVRALVGRDAARTQRRADRLGIPEVCTSLGAALALDGVDAVTIATPPDTHAALAIEACNAGRHVVCEKPFALDAHEAAEMLEAAEQAQVTHLVGHEFRWSPDRALVARGDRCKARSASPARSRWCRSYRWSPTPTPRCRAGGSTARAAAAGSARRGRTSSTSCARGSASSRR